MGQEMANSPRRIAALKIGSTSVAVLVADRMAEPLLQGTWVLRLMDAPDPAARLAPLLRQLAPALGPGTLVGVGEVGRRRPELTRWLEAWGWALWQLAGAEEARCAWWGVQAGMRQAATVVDVGGGSTEVSDGTDAVSWAFGAAAPPATDRWAVPSGLTGRARRPVAVGGTARALASLAGPAHIVSRTQLAAWVDDPEGLLRLGVDHRVDPDRLPLLAGGGRSLLCAMTLLGVDDVEVSNAGLIQGLWLAARLGRVPHAR